MKNLSKYLKIEDKPRTHKVTSANIFYEQAEFMEKKGLKSSTLIRDLLEDFLVKTYGQEYLKTKPK